MTTNVSKGVMPDIKRTKSEFVSKESRKKHAYDTVTDLNKDPDMMKKPSMPVPETKPSYISSSSEDLDP